MGGQSPGQILGFLLGCDRQRPHQQFYGHAGQHPGDPASCKAGALADARIAASATCGPHAHAASECWRFGRCPEQRSRRGYRLRPPGRPQQSSGGVRRDQRTVSCAKSPLRCDSAHGGLHFDLSTSGASSNPPDAVPLGAERDRGHVHLRPRRFRRVTTASPSFLVIPVVCY
ncbi:hypothetical protein VHUM_03554 [Vanrija humicola]|uniref:Uncharacterized protein n=1 Tax=Vanrija humicola TaxID=5417 RepID=A0A7D8YVY8_VANHU|nr:hypothetical protein VHUM_03554 [Vanrija humicola]